MNVHPFMLYSGDHNFNCPNCGKVQFEKYWLPKYVNRYEPVFSFDCMGCNTSICITFINDKLYVWRFAWFREWYTKSFHQLTRQRKVWRLANKPYHMLTRQEHNFLNYNKIKILKMAKKINVDSHVKRYDGVGINDKIRLIEALNQSIEEDKKKLREKLQRQIQILDEGGIPEDDEPVSETDSDETITDDDTTADTFPESEPVNDFQTEQHEENTQATGRRKRK